MEKMILIFDLDDTLYDRTRPFQMALERATRRKIQGDVRAWYSIYSRHSQDMFEAHARGEISLEESHILRIRYAAAELGIELTEEQEQAYQIEYERAQGEISMSDTMKAILSFCCENEIPIGILTNGPVKNQNRKIQALGLKEWIPEEKIFISEGIGYTKPDEQAFRYVEEVLHAKSEELCMIGDSYSSDIAGAKKAGWRTIWLNKDRKAVSQDEVQPDYIVSTEEELLEFGKMRMGGNGYE